MDRGSYKCIDCIYFSPRECTEKERQERPYDPPDGWCNKIFPRGYVGAGKPGGKIHRYQSSCFQFEAQDKNQMRLEE